MGISDQYAPQRAVCSLISWLDSTFQTPDTCRARGPNLRTGQPAHERTENARRHLRPCTGNEEEETKQVDRRTSRAPAILRGAYSLKRHSGWSAVEVSVLQHEAQPDRPAGQGAEVASALPRHRAVDLVGADRD